jgi:hypothetical protein
MEHRPAVARERHGMALAHEVDVRQVVTGVEADEERDADDLRREEPGPGEARDG